MLFKYSSVSSLTHLVNSQEQLRHGTKSGNNLILRVFYFILRYKCCIRESEAAFERQSDKKPSCENNRFDREWTSRKLDKHLVTPLHTWEENFLSRSNFPNLLTLAPQIKFKRTICCTSYKQYLAQATNRSSFFFLCVKILFMVATFLVKTNPDKFIC